MLQRGHNYGPCGRFSLSGRGKPSLLGSQLVQFALVWWLTTTTRSASVLALATMMAVLPQILLTPFAGALVDRWNRRTVMVVADAVVALATGVLAVLHALDIAHVWHVYALMFLRAAGGGFHWPAMQASTSLMVPRQHLSRVGGLNQAVQGVASILMPPLGALALELLPMQYILGIDVSTAILAITPLLFVPVPQPVRQESPEVVGSTFSVLVEMRDGLRFVWGWRGMMMLIAIAMLLNMFFGPAYSLAPIMVTEYFGGGAPELGWLQSAGGIGTILGGVTLGIWGGLNRRIITLLLAAALQGFAAIVLGLTPATALQLAVGMAFLNGFMNPISGGAFCANLQTTVPPVLQGRVFTVLMSAAQAMSPLRLAIAGPVSDALGVQAWFLIAGAAEMVTCVGALFVPAIMGIEDEVTEAAAL
jgi:DHA3 family macrolide efflux protein-like MFS transporter